MICRVPFWLVALWPHTKVGSWVTGASFRAASCSRHNKELFAFSSLSLPPSLSLSLSLSLNLLSLFSLDDDVHNEWRSPFVPILSSSSGGGGGGSINGSGSGSSSSSSGSSSSSSSSQNPKNNRFNNRNSNCNSSNKENSEATTGIPSFGSASAGQRLTTVR